ncbi:hypothetical protein [Acidovorax sp. BLS4]|uniref:hypothetical protein n=1 Tax=Acidovorax sp. BLS4 TaxID=3273430 RepID=UPI002941FE24|nr:hypothetical protein [Paracidovorax avenae]WOI45618.1 hypothetical protein R1Z03_24800 [Paracidovorax avenae]
MNLRADQFIEWAFFFFLKKGVPVYAILGCTAISYISVIFNYLSPDKIFLFLVNASGGVALLVYLVIAFSQLRLRRKYEKENPDALKLKMWLFPYLTILISPDYNFPLNTGRP